MRFDASKRLAVTPEGDAELLDMEERKAVRPALAYPVRDRRPERPNVLWQPRRNELLEWEALQTCTREAGQLIDAMREPEPLAVPMTGSAGDFCRIAATA